MSKNTSKRPPYGIFFLLLLFFVLYYYEKKQSYSLKTTLPLQTTETAVPQHDKKQEDNKNQGEKIIIKNGITKEMLTYKHWTGSHTPSTFVVTIANHQLGEHATVETETTTQKTIVIRYDYSFMHGYKTGSREIEFGVLENKKQYLLTFSWHQPGHLVLEDAAIVRATVVAFDASLELKKA